MLPLHEPHHQMGWLQSLLSPLKKLWFQMHSTHKKSMFHHIILRSVFTEMFFSSPLHMQHNSLLHLPFQWDFLEMKYKVIMPHHLNSKKCFSSHTQLLPFYLHPISYAHASFIQFFLSTHFQVFTILPKHFRKRDIHSIWRCQILPLWRRARPLVSTSGITFFFLAIEKMRAKHITESIRASKVHT